MANGRRFILTSNDLQEIRVDATDIEVLLAISRSDTRRYNAAAGEVRSTSVAHCYRVGALWIDTPDTYLITGHAVDVGDGDELFTIGARRHDVEGDKFVRPSVRSIDAPSDLALTAFEAEPLQLSLVRAEQRYLATDGESRALVDVALIAKSAAGERLLVDARCDDYTGLEFPVAPLDLVITTSDRIIAERLEGTELVALQT
jgi:hypothetical protein